MLEPYQKTIIELFYKQEVLLSRLYEKFAAQFPQYADFWCALSLEEKEHAKWIKKFYHAEKEDLVFFDEGRVKTYTLQTMVGHIEKVLDAVDQGGFSLEKAIAYTLDFERSLIEKDVFKHFQSANKGVRVIMEKLERETKNHINKAQALKTTMTKPNGMM